MYSNPCYEYEEHIMRCVGLCNSDGVGGRNLITLATAPSCNCQWPCSTGSTGTSEYSIHFNSIY